MLSAFAVRRSQVSSPIPEDINTLSGSHSEGEEPSIPLKVPIKRKPDTVEESSTVRKRKKNSQRTKETNGTQLKPTFAPSREYSPSVLVAASQDAAMMGTEVLNADPIISTFVPSLNQNVFFDDTTTSLYLVFNPLETISFVGTISLTIIQGAVTLFGSQLQASTTRHSVYAPKNYPTATIQADDVIEAQTSLPAFLASYVNSSHTVIMIQDLQSGIQGLDTVCGIQQSSFEATNELSFDFKLREFHPVLHGNVSRPPFRSPLSWLEAMEQPIDQVDYPIMLVKGPKNSGKSMFGRALVNRLLQRYKRVAYLDCDVGQTEFTPPGLVSLHILSHSLLGPPFTHIIPPFKAHFVGSTSFRSSFRHYKDCIMDLLDTYQLSVKCDYNREEYDGDMYAAETADPSCIEIVPLVINTFGWTKGTGADALQLIEERAEVTHIFTFESDTQDGAWHVDEVPRLPGVRYFSLEPIQPSRFDTSPSDKRALMLMSYFHQKGNKSPSWNFDIPLCAIPPWEVSWATAIDRIVLIGTGSEDVHRSEVLRVLNGAIVALLAIDSVAPGWSEDIRNKDSPPYTQGLEPPSPTFSHCIGYALVRSVRASSGTLQILTPIPPDQLSRVRVLVMGEIKLPIWGMLDHRAESKSTGRIAGIGFASVPFLQWTSGSQDVLGSRRLRVRRNLMRKSQL